MQPSTCNRQPFILHKGHKASYYSISTSLALVRLNCKGSNSSFLPRYKKIWRKESPMSMNILPHKVGQTNQHCHTLRKQKLNTWKLMAFKGLAMQDTFSLGENARNGWNSFKNSKWVTHQVCPTLTPRQSSRELLSSLRCNKCSVSSFEGPCIQWSFYYHNCKTLARPFNASVIFQ